MAKIYANKIMLGRMTIDEVPDKHKAEVLAILKERGWTE